VALVVAAAIAAAEARAAGLREGFEGAVGLNAELRALAAQRDVLAARRRGAQALLPGAPSVDLGWRTDIITNRRGFEEYDVSVSAPLWLPGEARALGGSVDAQEARLAARAAQQRLVVAGEVRNAYWAWAAAGGERDAARSRVAAAQALERDTNRQVAAGNAPRADLLLATADLRDAQAALRAAEAAVRDAALAFRALTGLPPTPDPGERPAAVGATPALVRENPQAAAARAAIALAGAEQRLAEVRDRASPDLFGGYRRERFARGEDYGDRLLIGIRIPFTYGPAVQERLALARADAVAAEATLATLERTLAAAEARARAQREDAVELARLAEERHRALAEQAALSEASYRAGQTAFFELVRVRAQLAQADAARRRARTEASRAASQINQVLGIEPR
jgi:outer membrane protein, heavy metal efflux system